MACTALLLATVNSPVARADDSSSSGPATRTGADADVPLQSLYLPRRRALLIGIGQANFRGVAQNPLPQCIIDAKTLAATLRPRGYACEVIADGEKIEPTASRIRDEVAAASGLAREQDTLLVYISTHGDVVDGKSVIIAQDDAVEIDWIKRHMAASRAAVKVLMLDCCRNNKGFERTATEVRDVHCIMACRPDQLSQVGQSGMSVFTEAMVDGLVECRADRVRDGKIELDELMYFLEREVPARAARVDKDKPQNPTRTVVDPKAVTPIFATCTTLDQLTFGPDAFKDTPPAPARTDLALADLTFLHIQPGMTFEQATEALNRHGSGTWTAAPVFDDKGAGIAILEGKPSPKDALVVRFDDKKVVLAHVLYTDLCKDPYNPLRTRAAIERLVGKSGRGGNPNSAPTPDQAKPDQARPNEPVAPAAPTSDAPGAAPDPAQLDSTEGTKAFAEGSLAALDVPLKGLDPAQIVEKLGCPDSALLPTGQFAGELGELRYPSTPRPAQMLVIRVRHGKFESVDIAVME